MMDLEKSTNRASSTYTELSLEGKSHNEEESAYALLAMYICLGAKITSATHVT